MSITKDNKPNNGYSRISIGLASPEEILAQSSGEVLKPETINYRTYKPERDGLFCERIFGPVKDYECHCGKYKRIRYKGIVCDRCGVEVTEKKVRRERMGHISLVVPVVHIWYFRSLPSKIGYLLGIPSKKLEAIIYYERYVVINAGAASEQGIERLATLSEKEYLDVVAALPKGNQSLDDSDPNKFVAQMGAEAIYTLLQQVDLDSMSYALRHKAYEEAQKLLNADPEEIALVESTSHGLNIAAQGIELQPGDNIITTNLEFIQVALPWCVMRREKKIEIRVCKTKDNRFTVDDFAALADERTRIIVMSTLEWCNGWASDMKAIGDFCQEKGIFLVVDAVQQLGVTKIDTKECHFDLLVAGGHKWLNSPYGTGVLYVNKNSLSKIKQSYAGYLNTTVPEGGWGAYWEKVDAQAVYDWTFPNTARKYEIGGTSNYAGAIALGESLGLVNEIGIENIQQRVWEIGEYCMDRWEEIGGTVITHRDPGRRGGIIITRLYQDVEQDRAILRELHSRQIFIAQRFTDHVGGFRISCSWVNNKQDIDNMIEAVKEIIASIGKAPDYKG